MLNSSGASSWLRLGTRLGAERGVVRGVDARKKATSQIMTLAHRCGVCNERLLTRIRATTGSGERALPKPFVLLPPQPILRDGGTERRAPPRTVTLSLGEDDQA